MGSQNSSSTNIRQKFEHMFQNNYEFQCNIPHEVFGDVALFANKNTHNVQIMMIKIPFDHDNQIQKITNIFQSRILESQPNLVSVYHIKVINYEQVCSSYKVFKIFCEYLNRTLKSDVRKRRKTNFYFTEEQIWKILKSLVNAIKYLHNRNTFHGEIKLENVMISNDYHLKLVDKILLGPNNWQIDYKNDSVKLAKGKGVLLSPALLRCLHHNKMQIICYDPFKADIFSLGMIMLVCCSLKKVEQFYDYEKFEVKYGQVNKTINQIKNLYSWQIVNLIETMLEDRDDYRPTISQLLNNISSFSKKKHKIEELSMSTTFFKSTEYP